VQKSIVFDETKKNIIFETISENLCFTVIVLGFSNVSPYNFHADINLGEVPLTAPNRTPCRLGDADVAS